MIVRKLRLEKGYSQEMLAQMAGISTRTLQRIERGAAANPETLKCIAAVLELDFSEIRKEAQMPTNTPVEPQVLVEPQPVAPTESVMTAPPAPDTPAPAASQTHLPIMDKTEQEAMEYVRDIKAFYVHAITYGIVILGLLMINLLTGPGYLWVFWAAFGWGIGLVSHGASVFEVVGFFGADWEKRAIARRLSQK